MTGLALTGCNVGVDGNPNDKQQAVSFESGKKGKDDDSSKLLGWVPDQASDIKEIVPTTGNERILMMKNAQDLPPDRQQIPGGQSLAPMDNPDNRGQKAADFSAGPATLSADWWPSGTEEKAIIMCGKWWITQAGDITYAYTLNSTPSCRTSRAERPDRAVMP